LNLTSQQWLGPKETPNGIWTHQLLIVRPDEVQTEDVGALYITGKTNEDPAIISTDMDAVIASVLATGAKVTSAALLQAPNQPISFIGDTVPKRYEDDLISYTWVRFAKNPSRPDLVAYFPMVKAAVAAMDAITEFTMMKVQKKQYSKPVSRFYISGASKRGGVTWLTAAFEGSKPESQRRIIGAAPIIYDFVNITHVLPRMYQLYNGWSFAFEPYRQNNLMQLIGTPALDILASVIDPLYPPYLAGIANIEKFVVTASDDEFMVTDSDQLWWHLMPFPKLRYIAPNASHGLDGAQVEVFSAIANHMKAIIEGRPRPHIDWRFTSDGSLVVESDQEPKKVHIYRAQTIPTEPYRRDFRRFKANIPGGCLPPAEPMNVRRCSNPVNWESKPVEGDYNPQTKTFVYKYQEMPDPQFDGWVGFYFMLEFPGGQNYTTQAVVLPDELPFAPCGSGEACFGTLV